MRKPLYEIIRSPAAEKRPLTFRYRGYQGQVWNQHINARELPEFTFPSGETLDLPAILCLTSSGATAFRVARERPKPPIVAISPKLETARRLAVLWGTHCVVSKDAPDIDAMVAHACNIAFREGFAREGQRVILVAGVPLGTPGATNMVRVAFVGSESAETD